MAWLGDTSFDEPAPVPAPFNAFTRRERQVLWALAHGLSDLQIAAQLSLYEAAVKKHVRHALAKLGITRAEAAIFGRRGRYFLEGPRSGRSSR